jgi:diguanylate cyclase (GGDEF)-like protein
MNCSLFVFADTFLPYTVPTKLIPPHSGLTLDLKPYPGAPVARHFQVRSDGAPKPELIPFGARLLQAIDARLEKLSEPRLYLLATVLLLFNFTVDIITGPEIALRIFYLVPVSMLAWHSGWRAARVSVLATMLLSLVSEKVAGQVYTHEAFLYWNVIARAVFFYVVAYTVSQLRRAVDQGQRLARTDSLTGASNSRSFLETAGLEVARQHRYQHPLSIGFLDCDNFKDVNDRYGHHTGDELLRDIAVAMHDALREIDVVARLGGDEFAVLLPESDAVAAAKVGAKIREALEPAVSRYGVTFSFGLVTYLVPPDNVEELVRTADQTMYEAKRAGKNSTRHRIITDHLASGTDDN